MGAVLDSPVERLTEKFMLILFTHPTPALKFVLLIFKSSLLGFGQQIHTLPSYKIHNV